MATLYNPAEIKRLMTMDERQEQASLFNWMDMTLLPRYPEIHPLFFMVPNDVPLKGSKEQRARQMNAMKKRGFVPGVADTLFLSGRGGYLYMALELKTPDRVDEKNGGLSENQQEFLRAVRDEGGLPAVAYGADHAGEIVTNYLGMEKTKDMILYALERAEVGDLEGCRKVLEEITRKW